VLSPSIPESTGVEKDLAPTTDRCGIAACSTRPLALASYAGLLLAGASMIFIVYAHYSWLKVGKTPQGWTSLMIVITATYPPALNWGAF